MLDIETRRRLNRTDAFAPENVVDRFKGMSVEEVRKELDANRKPFHIVCQNLTGDFNIGQIVRGCNAFGCAEVVIAGLRGWDKRGAVGTYHYEDVLKVDSVEEYIEYIRTLPCDAGDKYTIIAAEITNDAIDITEFKWPEHVVLVVGEEGLGLSQETIDLCDFAVYIPMVGSVRSLNVAAATQIMMYDYMRQNRY